jgi:hypothetical protein
MGQWQCELLVAMKNEIYYCDKHPMWNFDVYTQLSHIPSIIHSYRVSEELYMKMDVTAVLHTLCVLFYFIFKYKSWYINPTQEFGVEF